MYDRPKGDAVELYSVAETDAVFIWLICLVLVTGADTGLSSSLYAAQHPAMVALKRHLIVVGGLLGIWGMIYIMDLSPTDIREAAAAYWHTDTSIRGKITAIVAWAALFSPLLGLFTSGNIERRRRAEMRNRRVTRAILVAD